MEGTIFGFTEAQIADFGVTFGLGAFMLYMLFIIGELAYRSKAGKVGTFALFLVLAFGMVGFVAKSIIQKMWGI
jgi:predicted Kef-type K+ transport protein